MQESLTPRERRQAQEVNALGLPVTIHLEDQLIPLPPPYPGPMEGGEVPEGSSSLWRSDTDGDLARWLNNGFTPRAAGTAAASLAAVVMRSTESNVRCRLHILVLCTGKSLQLGVRGNMLSSCQVCWSGLDKCCAAWLSLSLHAVCLCVKIWICVSSVKDSILSAYAT